MIRFLFSLFLISLLCVPAARAQLSPVQPDGEIIAKPICSALVNRSSQTILGTLSTAAQARGDGRVVKNSDNFRLAAGERKEFCASGPFFAGRRLQLVLRTLLPLFDCKTKIDHEIFLDAKPNEYGFKKLSATCS